MTIDQVRKKTDELIQEIAQKAIERNFVTKRISNDMIQVNLPDGDVIYWVCYDHVMDIFYTTHIGVEGM